MPTPDKLLEIYTDLTLQIDQANAKKKEMIDQAIPQEVKDQLDDIDAEINPYLEDMRAKQKMVEDQLRYSVINAGVKKVEGAIYSATLVKGRTTWDTKTLEGMIALVPQIQVARKTGDPSVRITLNKR
jgi:hypothetical protein